MSRQRVRDPKGQWLYPVLLNIIDKDERGRGKTGRLYYDDERVDLDMLRHDAGGGPIRFYIVWMTDAQLAGEPGEIVDEEKEKGG